MTWSNSACVLETAGLLLSVQLRRTAFKVTFSGERSRYDRAREYRLSIRSSEPRFGTPISVRAET
jgi:hypothetical protein